MDQVINDEHELSINDRINEIISLEQLRNELTEIVAPLVAKSSLFDSRAGWKAFLRVLLESLVDKPTLRGKRPRTKRYVAQLLLEVTDLSRLDQAYVEEIEPRQGAVFWRILVSPIGYWLTGPLAFTSKDVRP